MTGLACWRVRQALPRVADRQEPADLKLQRHLRTCPRCRRAASQYRALRVPAGPADQFDGPDPLVRPDPPRFRLCFGRSARSLTAKAAAAAAGVAFAGALLSRRAHRLRRA